MFMKIAKMRENRKENKGFSLVELIIVMAIMVALIAVLAPQFIKYVQRSRDAVVGDAAENVLSCVKSEIALGNISNKSDSAAAVITIKTDDNGFVTVEEDENVNVVANTNYEDFDAFVEDFCGVDLDKNTKTQVEYQISIDTNNVATCAQTVDSNGEEITTA